MPVRLLSRKYLALGRAKVSKLRGTSSNLSNVCGSKKKETRDLNIYAGIDPLVYATVVCTIQYSTYIYNDASTICKYRTLIYDT